ncbi:MAG: hypothetical protein E7341_04355 [Clostridiales bacterium]|nr:hypothetical protein [Clostridiales bacterium]
MFDYEGMSNKMHYERVLGLYNSLCEKYKVEKAPKVAEAEALQGSYAIKHSMVRDEFKKLLAGFVAPEWESLLPKYFEEKEMADAKEIMFASLEMLPEDGYDLFVKNFRTLNYLDAGREDDIRAYVADSVRYMSLDEVICHFDFLMHSKYGKTIIDGIVDEIERNEAIAPEIKAYFEARVKERKQQAKLAKKQAKKLAKKGEPAQSEKQ